MMAKRWDLAFDNISHWILYAWMQTSNLTLRKHNYVLILFDFVQCDLYENIHLKKKVSMKLTPKHNHLQGVSILYENVQMG